MDAGDCESLILRAGSPGQRIPVAWPQSSFTSASGGAGRYRASKTRKDDHARNEESAEPAGQHAEPNVGRKYVHEKSRDP